MSTGLSKREEREMVESALVDGRLGPNNWIRTDCPFCVLVTGKEDKRWSLGVHAESGYYHCFKCAVSGRIKVVDQPIQRDDYVEPEIEVGPIDPPEGYFPLWHGDALRAVSVKPIRTYLRSRGFGRETWERAKIGATFDGQAADRVIIPILASDGETWLGWAARDWTGKQIPKYLYPPGMPRGTILFEHRVLLEETQRPALCVEGTLDALPYPGDAFACLGKPSKWQKQAMRHAKRPIVICLDGDAWEEAYVLSMQLRLDDIAAGFVRLPPKEDPCSMALKHGADWLREQALRAL